jgi:hypothetical protein
MNELEAGLRTMYERIDATDPAVFADLFAADGALVFNGGVVARTPAEILAFIRAREAEFARIVHHIDTVFSDPVARIAAAEIRVEFTGHDGTVNPLHGIGIVDYAGDRIAAWRIYVDTGAAT